MKKEFYCWDTGEIVEGKLNVVKATISNLIHYKIWTPHWGTYIRNIDVVI